MNAPEKLGVGKKPRNGNTAKAIEYIRKQVTARTDQIAEHLGIDRGAVQPLLYSYVKSGDLITCLVEVPGKRHPLTEYRIGSGIPLGTGRGWKGEKFALGKGRPARLGESLADKDIAAASGQGRPAPRQPVKPAPTEQASPTEQRAATPPQPAVGQNTGSAPVATPSTPPGDGAHRKPSAPTAKASAKGADAIRFGISNAAELMIVLGDDTTLFTATQTRQLGEFLANCTGVWDSAP